jgi:hypothetical protein
MSRVVDFRENRISFRKVKDFGIFKEYFDISYPLLELCKDVRNIEDIKMEKLGYLFAFLKINLLPFEILKHILYFLLKKISQLCNDVLSLKTILDGCNSPTEALFCSDSYMFSIFHNRRMLEEFIIQISNSLSNQIIVFLDSENVFWVRLGSTNFALCCKHQCGSVKTQLHKFENKYYNNLEKVFKLSPEKLYWKNLNNWLTSREPIFSKSAGYTRYNRHRKVFHTINCLINEIVKLLSIDISKDFITQYDDMKLIY